MPKKSTGPRKNPHAMAMVRRRMQVLTPERRSEIATKAARARWAKRNRKKA